MSTAFHPVLKDPIADLAEVDGKALSRSIDFLDRLALDAGVTPLTQFVSVDDDEYGILEDADIEWSGPGWFPADEGLKTVRALLGAVGQRPEADEALRQDLRALEEVLMKAAERHVDWHLAIDM